MVTAQSPVTVPFEVAVIAPPPPTIAMPVTLVDDTAPLVVRSIVPRAADRLTPSPVVPEMSPSAVTEMVPLPLVEAFRPMD